MIKQLYFILISFLFLVVGFSQPLNAQLIESQNNDFYKNNEDKIIVAYSNQNKNVLFIKSKDASLKIKNVVFYSILGIQVAEYMINSSSKDINIDKLRSGKYLMKYTLNNNTQQVVQIIKQ